MEDAAEPVDNLLQVLGHGMSRQAAAKLLQDAEGSLELAVAMHFSASAPVLQNQQQQQQQQLQQGAAAVANGLPTHHGSSSQAPQAGLQELRMVLNLGPGTTDGQLARMLKLAGGSVQQAVDTYFETGQIPAADADSQRDARSRQPAAASRGRRRASQAAAGSRGLAAATAAAAAAAGSVAAGALAQSSSVGEAVARGPAAASASNRAMPRAPIPSSCSPAALPTVPSGALPSALPLAIPPYEHPSMPGVIVTAVNGVPTGVPEPTAAAGCRAMLRAVPPTAIPERSPEPPPEPLPGPSAVGHARPLDYSDSSNSSDEEPHPSANIIPGLISMLESMGIFAPRLYQMEQDLRADRDGNGSSGGQNRARAALARQAQPSASSDDSPVSGEDASGDDGPPLRNVLRQIARRILNPQEDDDSADGAALAQRQQAPRSGTSAQDPERYKAACDRALDSGVLYTCKTRQPALPVPWQDLPLPFKDLRRCDGTLFCTNPEQVPSGPIAGSVPKGNVTLGKISFLLDLGEDKNRFMRDGPPVMDALPVLSQMWLKGQHAAIPKMKVCFNFAQDHGKGGTIFDKPTGSLHLLMPMKDADKRFKELDLVLWCAQGQAKSLATTWELRNAFGSLEEKQLVVVAECHRVTGEDLLQQMWRLLPELEEAGALVVHYHLRGPGGLRLPLSNPLSPNDARDVLVGADVAGGFSSEDHDNGSCAEGTSTASGDDATPSAGRKRKAAGLPMLPAGSNSRKAKKGKGKAGQAQQQQEAVADKHKRTSGEADPTWRVEMTFIMTSKMYELLGANHFQSGLVTDSTIKANKLKRRGYSDAFGAVLQALLLYGWGLWLGPDSDGLLNFCHQDDAGNDNDAQGQAGNLAAAAASSSQAAAASSSRAAAAAAAAAAQPAAAKLTQRHAASVKVERLHDAAFDLQHLLDSVKLPASMPLAAVPAAIQSQPKPFQLQGLEWMLRREQHGDALNRGLLHLHPSWLQLVTKSGHAFYVHRHYPHYITSNFLPAPVGGTCGGFLCDEMGLGKTLISLMAIVSNPPPPGWAVTSDVQVGEFASNEPVPIKTTLLVMPANLLVQWQEEIVMHVKQGHTVWATYDGMDAAAAAAATSLTIEPDTTADEDAASGGGPRPRRTGRMRTPAAPAGSMRPGGAGSRRRDGIVTCRLADGGRIPLHRCDIVLMSYEQLRKELGSSNHSPLLRYGFWRIMLDEAQLVANSSSVAAQMASSLWRRHAWVVTGTPITARLSEIQGLCEFLALEPFYHNTAWRHLLQLPYESRTLGGLLSLRSVLRGVMLRRTKAEVEAQLHLPLCSRIDCSVQLGKVERAFYEQIKKHFLQVLSSMKQATAMQRRNEADTSSKAKVGPKVMAQLTALRQCCCHPQIAKRGTDSLATSNRLSMRQIMGRLVTKAYAELDAAAAALMSSRLQLAALQDLDLQMPGEAVQELLEEVHMMVQLVSGTDLRYQARLRSLDGSIVLGAQPLFDGRQQLLAAAAGVGMPNQLHPHLPLQVQPRGAAAAAGSALLGGCPPGTAAAAPGPANRNGQEAAPAPAAAAGDAGGGGAVGAPAAGPCQTATAAGTASADDIVQEQDDKEALEAAKERHRRWLKIQLDGLQLLSYVIRLRYPEAARHKFNDDAAAAAAAASAAAAPGIAPDAAGGGADAGAPSGAADAAGGAGASAAGVPGAAAADTSGSGVAAAAAAAPPDAMPAPSGSTASASTAAMGTSAAPAPSSSNQPGPPMIASNKGTMHVASDEERPSKRARRDDAGKGAGPAQAASLSSEDQAALLAWAAGRMQYLRESIHRLRLELGLPPILDAAEAELRRSSRQAHGKQTAAAVASEEGSNAQGSDREFDEDDELEDEELGQHRKRRKKGKQAVKPPPQPETAEDLFLRSEVVVRNFQALIKRQHPCQSAMSAIDAAKQQMASRWHNLQHLISKESDLAAAQPGVGHGMDNAAVAGPGSSSVTDHADTSHMDPTGAASSSAAPPLAAPAAAGSAAGGGQGEHEPNVCPICLDECDRRTVTSCGHSFCSDCINEIVAESGSAPCPICRKPLSRKELFDAVTEEEASQLRLAEIAGSMADFGAKVSSLLQELAAMRAADPAAKAVVFSSWGRLLRLVGEALQANGMGYESLAGGAPDTRQRALGKFLKDPGCTVLLMLMSNSSGAAGLTLTVATTAFILEPALNPGLEAQAAARIYRLGQSRPTRVIRLLAEDTVEQRVLDLQRYKLQGNEMPAAEGPAQEIELGTLVRFFWDL